MKKILSIILLSVLTIVNLHAVVTADNTLPMNSTVTPGGNVYGITNGTIQGTNLFHSFSEFSLTNAETAFFNNGAGIDIIFSRVTGSNISLIDGTFQFNNPAACFFINPNGVIFGPNANLDIGSSIFVGTPDYISFADGGRFDATTPANDILTAADFSAFGFIDDDIGRVTINGSDFSADFTADDNVAIVGGNIDITGGSKIFAKGGRLDLLSVASSGEVKPPAGSAEPVLEGFTSYGNITVASGSGMVVSNAEGSGDIYIRSGNFTLDGAGIRSDTSNVDGGEIKIQCDNFIIKNGGIISVNTNGAGKGGDIWLLAENSVLITGFNVDPTWLLCATSSLGDAGTININSSEIVISDRGNISGSVVGGSGTGADINLIASDYIKITDNGNINTITTADGKGGVINISTPYLEVSNDGALVASNTNNGVGGGINLSVSNLLVDKGLIAANSSGPGNGGEIIIQATDSVILKGVNNHDVGKNDGQLIRTASNHSGDGGRLFINSPEVKIYDGAQVTAAARSTGNGGSIYIEADNLEIKSNIYLPDRGTGIDTSGNTYVDAISGNLTLHIKDNLNISGKNGIVGINSSVEGNCSGGYIEINAKDISIEDGGAIYGKTSGSGNSGTIIIKAENSINVSGINTELNSNSIIASGTESSGYGGYMNLTARNVNISNNGLIESNTDGTGDGGYIEIKADNLTLTDTGLILCHTKGQGNGGFIDINAETLNLRGKSILSAASFASGNGGFIGLNLTTCNIKSGSQINSSTFGSGKSGTIELKAEGWVNIQGDKSGLISKSGPNSSGDAGYILVETGNLTMSETAKINTSSEGIGNAGNIDLITEKIDLESGAKVSSVSSGTGKAGGIIIKASDRISLDQSTVSVQSKDADGGDIDIYTTYWLKLQNSKISAEVKGGTGNGGNIYIDPIYVILENSSIIANAFGGSGGNITIVTNLYLKNIASIVSASSKLGIDGSVEIFAPDIDVSSSLQALPVNFEEVEKMLPERCSARTRGDSGSFQITGRYALPSDPDAVIFFP